MSKSFQNQLNDVPCSISQCLVATIACNVSHMFTLYKSSDRMTPEIRARPINFFRLIPMFFNFQCRYPIFLYYSSSIYFTSWGKITTPGAILPSAKHFQTTAERHYRAYFSSGHINKENNFTSYNYFMRQDIHSWNYFATS